MPLTSLLTRTSPKARGYTAVELMMSIGLFTVAVVGLVSMQNVTINANRGAKNVAMASRIAESWMDELSADSAQWNETDDFGNTAWLVEVGAEDANNSVWFQPDWVAARNFGAAFDALGNPVATADITADAHFCTHLRLTWLRGQTTGISGNGLIRAEVRVFWPRTGILNRDIAPLASICTIAPANFDAALGHERYQVILMSTSLSQHLEGT